MRLASFVPYLFLLSVLGVSAAPAFDNGDLVAGRFFGGDNAGPDWKRAMENDGQLL
ncbi:hypothetical protein BGW80DRAFT_1457915 [Lactifluus volemus]|nr:hypothetical protein BGW80DRAFT_1457915 [Lactifluus volemus]